jgi:hypothetical protein
MHALPPGLGLGRSNPPHPPLVPAAAQHTPARRLPGSPSEYPAKIPRPQSFKVIRRWSEIPPDLPLSTVRIR